MNSGRCSRSNPGKDQGNTSRTDDKKVLKILGKKNYAGYENEFQDDDGSKKRAKVLVRAQTNAAINTCLSNIENIETLKTYAITLRTDLIFHMEELHKEKDKNLHRFI